MALFSSKKNTAAPVVAKKEVKEVKEGKTQVFSRNFASVLKRPRITEKASLNAERNVYIFDVETTVTKKTIVAAVKDFYKVTPIKVNVVTIPRKQVFIRGKRGAKGGGKKAYVYLKKGDKIEFV